MTRDEAAALRVLIEARWPEATEVSVTAEPDGARVELTAAGRQHIWSVADEGTLRRFLVDGSL